MYPPCSLSLSVHLYSRQRLIAAFKEAFKAITNESKEEEFTVEEESIHSGEEAAWQ